MKHLKNYINESSIKSMLKNLIKLNLGEAQLNFYKWKLKSYKSVKIVSYKSDPQLKILIDKHLIRNKINLKDCYTNSFDCANKVQGVSYIEGEFLVHGVPIEHAWNKYKNIYFDLTSEVLLNDIKKSEYVKYIELDTKNLMKYALKLGYKGPFISEYYDENILK